LQAQGINAAAITYDSRAVLSNFAETYKIGYPLLSDAGSKVIREFGIFNTNIPPDHKMMYGIPWPGDYLIAPDGTVRDKWFLPNYEHRTSASAAVLRHFEGEHGNSARIEAGVVKATVALSSDRCFPGQELGLMFELHFEPGWHVYGQPLPAQYQAIELRLESPLIAEQSLDLPEAHPLLLKALGETLPVYAEGFKAHGKVGVKWSPPMPAKFLEALGDRIEPGAYKIAGTLRFQACSDDICETPQSVKFELPLTIDAGVPPAPKKTA
jgi:hypothetical protein